MQLIVKAQNDLVWDTQPEDSDIFFVKERLTREDEVDLYASAHCYVSASRGEGWGLCPHQAIAQGCPTILGNAGGQAEFARWGLPVECHDVPADYGIWQDTGNWWEPDYDQLVARMDEVVTDYDRVREEAKRNADGIAHLTWENTARQLAALFSTDPPVEPTEWHTFKRKLYPIEVTKDMRCDVGGLVYSFTPGITYFEFADVKRILYMSGVLHPDCPSEGLLPDQITERAQAVETECPHCHRPYPSVTELADEVAAELAALGIGQA